MVTYQSPCWLHVHWVWSPPSYTFSHLLHQPLLLSTAPAVYQITSMITYTVNTAATNSLIVPEYELPPCVWVLGGLSYSQVTVPVGMQLSLWSDLRIMIWARCMCVCVRVCLELSQNSKYKLNIIRRKSSKELSPNIFDTTIDLFCVRLKVKLKSVRLQCEICLGARVRVSMHVCQQWIHSIPVSFRQTHPLLSRTTGNNTHLTQKKK